MRRGEELKPVFKKTALTRIKEKKSVKNTSLIKTEAAPEDIYTIPRVHPRVKQKPMHRPGHAGAVVQIHQQQHKVLVFEQPRETSR